MVARSLLRVFKREELVHGVLKRVRVNFDSQKCFRDLLKTDAIVTLRRTIHIKVISVLLDDLTAVLDFGKAEGSG